MPFPLAHPVAVLPLRRYCNRYLNFSALLIGSITPDVSYCFEKYHVDAFAHKIRGCFGFSLPVGWLLTLIFFAVREPLVKLLPAPHRQALLPSCRTLNQMWFVVPLSVLIGAFTHIFLDAFTHETGWFAERSDFLQTTLFMIGEHKFRVYRLLWHIVTWAGLLCLLLAYAQTLKKWTGSAKFFSMEEKNLYALWAVILLVPLVVVLPFSLWHLAEKSRSLSAIVRCIHASMAVYLVAVSVLLIGIGIGLKMKHRAGD